MLEAFLCPLLWVLGFGIGALVIAFAAFLGYCWLRSLADGGESDGGDGEDEV